MALNFLSSLLLLLQLLVLSSSQHVRIHASETVSAPEPRMVLGLTPIARQNFARRRPAASRVSILFSAPVRDGPVRKKIRLLMSRNRLLRVYQLGYSIVRVSPVRYDIKAYFRGRYKAIYNLFRRELSSNASLFTSSTPAPSPSSSPIPPRKPYERLQITITFCAPTSESRVRHAFRLLMRRDRRLRVYRPGFIITRISSKKYVISAYFREPYDLVNQVLKQGACKGLSSTPAPSTSPMLSRPHPRATRIVITFSKPQTIGRVGQAVRLVMRRKRYLRVYRPGFVLRRISPYKFAMTAYFRESYKRVYYILKRELSNMS